MTDEKRLWITRVAISSLEQWYVTWELFRKQRDPEVRRRAICCKAHGLVWHDRHLVRGMEVFCG